MNSSSTTLRELGPVYLLEDPGLDSEYVGDADIPIGREFDILRGEWVPAAPVMVRRAMGKKSPGDFVWTTLANPVVVGPRVLTVLRDGGFTGWSTYPVLVHDHAGAVVDGYAGLAVTGRCGAIDDTRSVEVMREYPGGVFPMDRGLFFNEEEWDGSDVFCPVGKNGYVFLTSPAVDALRAAKIGNVFLQPAAEVERDMFRAPPPRLTPARVRSQGEELSLCVRDVMTPEWYTRALANTAHPTAAVAFTRDFLAASAPERMAVAAAWDPQRRWALPNPWRLACVSETPGSPRERVLVNLLFQALGFSEEDERESIRGFAVAFNSCELARLNAKAIFEDVARAVSVAAGDAISAFASRQPEDQCMGAFMLTATEDPGGGYEIKANWG